MRNQHQYNVIPRKLNIDEEIILKSVEEESGMKLNIVRVQYLRHIPRATVCIVTQRIKYLWGLMLTENYLVGVSIRSKTDLESPEVGRLISFRRALEEYVEGIKRENKSRCL